MSWLEDYMKTASPEAQERMKEMLRDPNFFIADGPDDVMAILNQLKDSKPE